MKKIYILTVGLTLFTSFLFSQNATLVLKGVMVSDGYNSPLEFATVVVNMPNSDEIVTGGITGEDGSFSVNVAPGTYDVTFEYIGFGKMIKKGLSIKTDTNLGKIVLAESSEALEEVEIIAEYDLVFTKGVLIHLNPQSLESVYKKIYNSSSRWILTIEYYSRSPQEIMYRGHENVLFKRDFAGELLDKYKNELLLSDYGFIYHRDTYPQDDLTWFLMEKQ